MPYMKEFEVSCVTCDMDMCECVDIDLANDEWLLAERKSKCRICYKITNNKIPRGYTDMGYVCEECDQHEPF